MEPTFTLHGSDPSAHLLVRLWIEFRKVSQVTDLAKLAEAESCATAMSAYCTKSLTTDFEDFIMDFARELGRMRFEEEVSGELRKVYPVRKHCHATTTCQARGCVCSCDECR